MFGSLSEFLREVVNFAVLVSSGIFGGMIFPRKRLFSSFSLTKTEIFQTLSVIFGKFFKNVFFCVGKNIWKRFLFFFRKQTSWKNASTLRENDFGLVTFNFPQEISKLLSTCPEKFLSSFSWKNYQYYRILQIIPVVLTGLIRFAHSLDSNHWYYPTISALANSLRLFTAGSLSAHINFRLYYWLRHLLIAIFKICDLQVKNFPMMYHMCIYLKFF